MRGGWQAFSNANMNAHLFEQFTSKAIFRGFAGIDLASGKFPLKRQAHGGAPLGCQDKAVMFDDGASYVNLPQIAHARPFDNPLLSWENRDIPKTTNQGLNRVQKKPPHRHPAGKTALMVFPVPPHTPSSTPHHKNALTLPRRHLPVNGSDQKNDTYGRWNG